MNELLPTQIKVSFCEMETSKFTFNQKTEGEGYAYCLLGFSGSAVSPF
jgi:hypothetical protein